MNPHSWFFALLDFSVWPSSLLCFFYCRQKQSVEQESQREPKRRKLQALNDESRQKAEQLFERYIYIVSLFVCLKPSS